MTRVIAFSKIFEEIKHPHDLKVRIWRRREGTTASSRKSIASTLRTSETTALLGVVFYIRHNPFENEIQNLKRKIITGKPRIF